MQPCPGHSHHHQHCGPSRGCVCHGGDVRVPVSPSGPPSQVLPVPWHGQATASACTCHGERSSRWTLSVRQRGIAPHEAGTPMAFPRRRKRGFSPESRGRWGPGMSRGRRRGPPRAGRRSTGVAGVRLRRWARRRHRPRHRHEGNFPGALARGVWGGNGLRAVGQRTLAGESGTP